MQCYRQFACVLLFALGVGTALGADWRQFRGPNGQGISDEKGLPVEWSASKNVIWKIKLPGAGGSSPVTVGDRIFVTCYSGYAALDQKNPGNMEDLRRHFLCVDQRTGKILWAKEFIPVLPEHKYAGEGAYHGYSSSTPTTDGERLYVFFGKSGVFCFDLDGKELWHASVGTKIHGSWGSAASPILYKNFLIVNASIESGALVALDKMTGKEEWRAAGNQRRLGYPGAGDDAHERSRNWWSASRIVCGVLIRTRARNSGMRTASTATSARAWWRMTASSTPSAAATPRWPSRPAAAAT